MVRCKPSGHTAQLKTCIGSEEVDQWSNGVSSQVVLCVDMPVSSLCPFWDTLYLNVIGLQEFLIESINFIESIKSTFPGSFFPILCAAFHLLDSIDSTGFLL